VGLPLIGNGDVFSPQEWQQRLAAAAAAEPEDDGTEGGSTAAAAAAGGGDTDDSGGCGVSTAMIGRAALIKPWIFTGVLSACAVRMMMCISAAFASAGIPVSAVGGCFMA
jgi:tRNA-dihydrouridine synthase